MKRLVYFLAATVLVSMAAISFTSAQATTPGANLHALVKSHLTFVHCRRIYHCYWTTKDHSRFRRCHVCG
jgi:hypothetical protein